MNVQENVPLAPLTTLGVGGAAKYLAEVKSKEEAQQALRFAREKNLPLFILSGGSNIVISDDGFPGLVILNRLTGLELQPAGDKTRIRAAAGESWDALVARSVSENLSGMELLSGIPGFVGAAPVQNIGAYGEEVGRAIVSVSALDIISGEEKELSREECAFGYRDSIFKSGAAGKYLITGVVFELAPAAEPDISGYPDVQKYFADKPRPTLAELRQAIIEIRAGKGMVLLPGYETYRSVGSFFKNPVVGEGEFNKVKAEIEREPVAPGCAGNWSWAQNGGQIKISAACLIERSGFPRGLVRGTVGISPKQPLAIINLGGARASDIVSFAKDICAAVKTKFGVVLAPEAQLVGFPENPFLF